MKVVPLRTFFGKWSMAAVGIRGPLEPGRGLSLGRDFEFGRIIDGHRLERQFPTQCGTVQFGKAPRLEAPSRDCNASGPETRNFLESA